MHGSSSLVMELWDGVETSIRKDCFFPHFLRLLRHSLIAANKETQPSSITCISSASKTKKRLNALIIQPTPHNTHTNTRGKKTCLTRRPLEITTENAPMIPEAFQTRPRRGGSGISQTSSASFCIRIVHADRSFPGGSDLNLKRFVALVFRP